MAAAWRSIASLTYSTGNTSLTINKPAGTVDGDILIAAIMSNGDWNPGFAAPSGWTEYTGLSSDTWGAAGTGRFKAYWKRASSEGASYTWSWTGGPLGVSGAISAYSGVTASGDPNNTTPTAAQGHDTAPTAPTLTTVNDNALLVMLGDTWNGGTTWTEPSGFTQRGDAGSSATMGMADALRTPAGAGGAAASLSAIDYWRVALIALTPADGAAAPTKITFVNAGAQTASNASPQAPALPTNHAAGDLLLLFCIQSSAAAITFTPPAGWTSIARNSNATRAMTIEVFAKIDNGSESAPSTACSSAAGGWATQIGCWRNVDDGVISDATAVLSDAAAAATFQPTGITINTVNAWVISFVGSKDDNALNFNTANGYTARMSGASYDDTAGNGSDYSVGVADQEFTTTGAKTCPTWNQSTNGNDAWVALTLALRPKTLVWGGRPDGAIGGFQMMQLLAL